MNFCVRSTAMIDHRLCFVESNPFVIHKISSSFFVNYIINLIDELLIIMILNSHVTHQLTSSIGRMRDQPSSYTVKRYTHFAPIAGFEPTLLRHEFHILITLARKTATARNNRRIKAFYRVKVDRMVSNFYVH